MQPLSVEYGVTDATLVRISWLVPYSNSEPITKYQIMIEQADGVFSETIAECDGSLQTISD
jgi:hypothetical protein